MLQNKQDQETAGLKIPICCWFPAWLQKQLQEQNGWDSAEFTEVGTAPRNPGERQEAPCTLQEDLTI